MTAATPGGADSAPAFSLGHGLRIRPVLERDAEEIYDVVVRNREMLSEWLPWAPEQTLSDTRAFILRSREQHAHRQGFQAMILERDRIVGGIGYHLLDWENRSTSIGYWLAKPAQGRGIMTRSVSALIDHAFSIWQLHRIEIRAGVGNTRSRAIPQRLGFSDEGVSREAELINGRYIDLVVYGLLAHEWQRRP